MTAYFGWLLGFAREAGLLLAALAAIVGLAVLFVVGYQRQEASLAAPVFLRLTPDAGPVEALCGTARSITTRPVA